tara:strand:+ start:349 stop:630 length:282 start_codon:yes stop_codon:yes gene_type:complete
MSNTAKFKDFHEANKHVYKTLVFMCRKYRNRNPGRQLGIATLWENLRWDYLMTTDVQDDFKLNNNHKPHYARMIMEKEPDLHDLFELREMHKA